MEEAVGGLNSAAPFLAKTYEMVDNSMTNSMVSWSESGCSFVVWTPLEFSRDLLPEYFKHNNFSSFVRQLNTYGFRKTDPDKWEFANDEFIRGESYRLVNIRRRKPIHSHSTQSKGLLTQNERQEYEEKIKRLKYDKNLLHLELQKNQKDKQEFEHHIELIYERFKHLESRHVQLTSHVAKLIQRPNFANKKRRLLNSYLFSHEGSQIDMSDPKLDMEWIDRLESSLKIWEALLDGIGNAIVTKPDSMLGQPNQAHSMNHIDGPVVPSICVHIDSRSSSSKVDINFEPASHNGIDPWKKQDETTKLAVASTGVNDQFWEQFLTETPVLLDSQAGRGALMAA